MIPEAEKAVGVHLKQALEEMHVPRFAEAMRIVGDFQEDDRG